MPVVEPVIRLAAAVVLLLAVAACSDTPDDVRPPAATQSATPSDPPSTSSPSATATPLTDSQRASRSASMVVQQYYRVLNELRQDDAEPLARLRAVATSLDLAAQERFIRGQRRDGLRQVGDTEVADLIVQSVDLNNSDPKAGLVPTVVVDVCYDVTRADIVDADGESVVPVDRPDRGWVRHTVANYNWDSEPAKAWRVASSKTIEREPCTA